MKLLLYVLDQLILALLDLMNPGHTLDKITLSILLSLHSRNKGEGERAAPLWLLVKQQGMQKLLNKTNACRQRT